MKNSHTSRNNSSYTLRLIVALALALNSFPSRSATVVPPQTQADAVAASEKTVNQARQSVTEADELSRRLSGLTSEIKRRSAGEEISQESITNVTAIARAVRSMNNADLAAAFKKVKADLASAKTKLGAAGTDLSAVTPATAESNAAKSRVTSTTAVAEDADKRLTEAGGELEAALLNVYEYVRGLAVKANSTIAALNRENIPEADLLILLPRDLPKLATVMRFERDLRTAWEDNLIDALGTVSFPGVAAARAAAAEKTTTALTALRESIASIINKMEGRMTKLAAFAKTNSGNIASLIEQLKRDPQGSAKEAKDRIREGTLAVANLDRVASSWDILAAQVDALSGPGSGVNEEELRKARTAKEGMFDAARDWSRSVGSLQASLGGDFSQFVTEKVKLYYFTDIPRLIKTLNDAAFIKGGDPAAQARSAEESQRLLALEGEFREADAEVAKFRARELALQRQLDDARADLNAASILKFAATRKLEELKRRPEGDVPKERMARAEEEKKLREDEETKARQRADELGDEQSGLPAKIREARQRRDEAQTELESLTSKLAVTAQNESAAFARARDNAPFWFASPDATNPDPLKRVELSSSTGGDNTITIRGAKEDVAKAKEYIAVLDEPAPQARMTLWKLELSSDASNEGTKKFNEALMLIEKELAETRAKIAGSLSFLLDTINEEANFAADSRKNDLNIRDARYFLYAPQVLQELGFNVDTMVGASSPRSFGLKDPAKVTTLNEGLLVLLLSKREARQNILYRFERRLTERLQGLIKQSEKEKSGKDKDRSKVEFLRFRNLLGNDLEYIDRGASKPSPPASDVELTRPQGELVDALRGRVIQRFLPRLNGDQFQNDIERYRSSMAKWRDLLRISKGTRAELSAKADVENWEDRVLPLLYSIASQCGINTEDVVTGEIEKITSDGTSIYFIRKNGHKTVCQARPTSARVAAADGLLDNFTKAFEDDLDREFIQPMLKRLRDRLRSSGIGVGVIQRTSVLATNRLVARVDPRASAELEVGQETNILQAVKQLAQLTLAAQTGGGLGVLGAFQAQAGDERPPEVFGLTTGNVFQVTPIFDPTGQALRFRFDFVGMTRIRDPDNSTNPRLPRIERHTVNTEVQLSNLEIREVSRFESNARLGQPTRLSGGIPLLRDIPGLRQVPLIGWFVKKTGKAAVTQQSLIFAQTTMSPTIGDILELSDDSILEQDNSNSGAQP